MYADWLTMAVQFVLMVALGYAAVWARRRWSAEQIALAANVARQAVQAVEQIATAAGWGSVAKKAQAEKRIRELAAKYGLRLTDTQWDTLIEAAVMQFTNAYRETLAREE